MSDDRVGRVLGVDPSTTTEFRVVLDADNYLQLDDLVVTRTRVPKAGEVEVYGLVTEVAGRFEGARFEGDMELIAGEGTLPAELSRSATVQVVRVLPEIWVAPDPGEEVFRAGGESREKALYTDEMERALPIGFGRDGLPVYLDLDFFDGRKGGHVSISGVSGVATKTSFALSLLRSLTAHPRVVGDAAHNLRVLVFNVKQEDLLWLDHPNRRLSPEAREEWTRLGIDPEPFPSVSFWAPPRRGGGMLPDTDSRLEGVSAFSWTPKEFVEQGLLRFLFTEAGDFRNQLNFVEERVRAQLQRNAEEAPADPGAVSIDGRGVRSLADLVEVIGEHLDPEDGADPDLAWTGRVQGGTAQAFMRRLHAAEMRLRNLIRVDGDKVDRSLQAVTVVDLHKLHDFAQRFVVGALLAEVYEEKERTGLRLPLQVVLLDEMNKYAPSTGQSPIKDSLVDIAQRGRSLGIILIGAQQSASKVASEIVENASIKVTGRLDAAEAGRDEYGWMLPSTRARAGLFKPGTMVLFQPAIPAAIVFTFPFPPWATRPEEVAEGSDPFAGL